MRACPVCGASNGETDDFCGNCGAYLGWSGSPPTRAPAAPAPDAPEPEPAPAPAGDPAVPGADAAPDRADPAPPAAAGSARPAPAARQAADTAPATPPATAPSPSSGASSVPPAPAAAEGAPPAPGPAAAAPRAVAPQAPAPQAPASASPQPVRPAKAVAPRPVVRPAAVSDSGAGVPCPVCGTPNPPERRFCRRCAAPLTPATAAAPLPWWRTVWPFHRRTRGGSGRMTRFLVVLAVVLALCAGGFLLLPAGRHLIEDTRDKLGKAKEVTAARVEASAEVPGHPVGDSTDGLSNRYWGAPAPGASATYTFAEPFRLVDVIITNGASASPEEYAHQARALRIDMEVTARDGRKVHKELVLSDKPGPQTFPTGISDATTVRLTLDAPAGAAPERHLALAEVEFFRRG
ncbi:zinc ribbon domain-containing protein [Streptomyces sp. NBC_00160]|uniref:zinc ribbon domain-containing protein n=1 Tax=Streptomyces sp. NBC_00160 TaxID=2903628 RepID=UPI0022549585|nr:zinc ribbon domain-containing protein [Streptomyces sp. NBC_00160]MCX5304464.1 zinc ribbon domain-containing protein [Streptomyces sp. NBC_00160]